MNWDDYGIQTVIDEPDVLVMVTDAYARWD